jgi:hypothetical protein
MPNKYELIKHKIEIYLNNRCKKIEMCQRRPLEGADIGRVRCSSKDTDEFFSGA